jgi:CubicO group peptidase (beta-lactamase class C family)
MFEKLTKKLDSFLEIGVPFYDCIVMKDGVCVYRHANGFTDAKKQVKVTGKEKYNIYSCSKLLTCVAALQLLEKGFYSLDDRLSDYLPEFEKMTVKCKDGILPAKNPILICQLFTMTAGFSYNLNSPQIIRCKEETWGECQTRDLMRYLAKEPLLFEPGERWEYSLCHDVLAALVEVLSGVTFGEYVKQNIFDPLRMTHSTFLLDDSRLDEIINQYCYDAEKGVIERDKHIPYKFGSMYESGGAGCISTVEDYIKLIEALRIGDVILKKETIDLLATNQLNDEQMSSYWVKIYGYGLGQRCPQDDRKSDFGWGGAAGAYYAIDRENGITVYMGTHILGYSKFQDMRSEILPIIQEMLK